MLLGCVLAVGTARAAKLASGSYSITAYGGGAETIEGYDDGHMDVAGIAVLNGKGGATRVNLTVAYQDDDEADDGPTCVLTNPADLTYSSSSATGVGTMTLTVGSGDQCFPGNDFGVSAYPIDETGNSITFALYVKPNQARLVSTSSDLMTGVDSASGEVIFAPTMSGEVKRITPVSIYGRQLLNGTGQTVDSDGDFGHESLAGIIHLNRKGGAKALDVTLVYSDISNYTDAETCQLTDPADLAYSLSHQVGTLTLTVGANDNCYSTYGGPQATVNNVGNSVTFNLYRGHGGLVLVSTNSNLIDANDDTISDPGIVGSLTR